MKMSVLDRLFLASAALIAAWQVGVGINGAPIIPMVAYTIGFGVILVACLLLVILGKDSYRSPFLVILSTIIPLSLSLGLVWEYLPSMGVPYLVFSLVGFLAITLTRLVPLQNRLPVYILAVVHGLAGLTLVILPLYLSIAEMKALGFALVALGGAMIGVNGLLLSFLRAGKPLLSPAVIYSIQPALLFLVTAAFVAGFKLG